MRKLITLACITAALSLSGAGALSDGLPVCAYDGDMDGDGVADVEDVDETDSCLASSSGLEDCGTGAGDGLPDCREE